MAISGPNPQKIELVELMNRPKHGGVPVVDIVALAAKSAGLNPNIVFRRLLLLARNKQFQSEIDAEFWIWQTLWGITGGSEPKIFAQAALTAGLTPTQIKRIHRTIDTQLPPLDIVPRNHVPLERLITEQNSKLVAPNKRRWFWRSLVFIAFATACLVAAAFFMQHNTRFWPQKVSHGIQIEWKYGSNFRLVNPTDLHQVVYIQPYYLWLNPAAKADIRYENKQLIIQYLDGSIAFVTQNAQKPKQWQKRITAFETNLAEADTTVLFIAGLLPLTSTAKDENDFVQLIPGPNSAFRLDTNSSSDLKLIIGQGRVLVRTQPVENTLVLPGQTMTIRKNNLTTSPTENLDGITTPTKP